VADELVRERRGPVLVARLNRPEARNALSPALIRGIGTAMLDAEADPDVRAVVLTGTGDRAFCAGMDLRAFAAGEQTGLGDDDASRGFFRLLEGEVTVPVVGAANATALAGGFELLLACDVIVASSEAEFGLPEVKRGLFPAGGGTLLGTRVALGVALEMTLTGDSIGVERAYDLGLVSSVVAPGAVLATFGVAHRTAYHVLRSVARVQKGDEVVVLGAGGGVGLATVQLARVLGASVTAVASSRDKLEAAALYGARNLIDHRSGALRQALREALPEGADVVVDPVGGDLSEPALRALRWGGRFVTVGYASGVIPKIPLNLVLLKGVQIVGFEFLGFATNAADEMRRNEAELMDHFAAGRVVPHIGAAFPLEDVAAALRQVADGKAIGKVIIDVASART
jgi:NADPH2:quinone reductase